jgi:molybdopterin converting factor subunit 1
MRVLVRYFAVLREQRGCEDEAVDVAEGRTVGELYAELFPAGPQGALPVMYAVNLSYVGAGHVLKDGDEVAFVPPLGGG